MDTKQNTRESLALEPGVLVGQLPGQVEDTFGMIDPEDIEEENTQHAERNQVEHVVTIDEPNQQLFAHIVPEHNGSETPPGLGVQAIRLSNG